MNIKRFHGAKLRANSYKSYFSSQIRIYFVQLGKNSIIYHTNKSVTLYPFKTNKMARKKGAVAAKVVAEKEVKPTNKAVESLYTQMTALLKKNKVAKRDVAERLGMSYQGFLNSFNNRNIRLEGWYEIGEMVNKPFVARFESARALATMEEEATAPAPVQAAAVASNDFTSLRLQNAEDKITILEKQIASLESQIQDKQTIIELIKK